MLLTIFLLVFPMPSDEELATHLIEEVTLAECVRLAQARVAEHTRQLNALVGLLRERTWRLEGNIVLTVLRRALNEAVARQRALEVAESKEAEALGEAARPASAAHEFLQKRIRAIEPILENPGRLRNVRDPRKLLEDNLIFFAE